jgi:nucleoside-diphosphate-sugar epimerase
VRDYARIYGLRTVVMRQSCIYGYRQFGIEDQGWVAWFIIAALKNLPIKIYGTGKQVRDVLFIDDLLNAYEAAVEQYIHICWSGIQYWGWTRKYNEHLGRVWIVFKSDVG